MNVKQKIKKLFVYKIFCKIRDEKNYLQKKRKYLKADDIKLVINDKNDSEKFLICKYSGSSGLMTQMVIVLGWLRYAKNHGFTLLVDMTEGKNMYRTADENVWEKFYKQPMVDFSVSKRYIENVIKNKNYAFCNESTKTTYRFISGMKDLLDKYPPEIIFPVTRDFLLNKELHTEWENLYGKYITPVDSVAKYLNDEYESIIRGKKNVLGVLVRGTDYATTKPYMHPIQPTANQVIDKINELKEKLNFEYIYLATDEYKTVQLFEKAFPNKILVNKREYYDGATGWLCDVRKERDNDAFLRGIEYYSSMNLLSKCDYFIAGLNGGSQASLIMNGGKFSFVYLFDLGDYL